MTSAALSLVPPLLERVGAVGLAGIVTWPFLLNGLLPRYFPELDRKPEDRLRALLGAGGPHLPTLSGWVADARMLLLLARYTLSRSPRTVVEFGSGVSTLVAAECLRRKGGGSIITHDHHSSFAAETAQRLRALDLEADVRSAPLCPLIAARNGWGGAWYDTEELPSRIDLLIVDGPPWFLHPMARGNAASLFSRIPRGGAVLLDDAYRPGERLVGARWRQEYPDFDFRLLPTRKGALLGVRR